MTVSQLERDLAARVDGEVRFDAGTRGAYSTDASNFRQVPIGVVLPRTVDAGAEAVAVCREHNAPVLSRGGGTSLAGQCTNTGVVIDWSKYRIFRAVCPVTTSTPSCPLMASTSQACSSAASRPWSPSCEPG